jgi:hypothetical protein
MFKWLRNISIAKKLYFTVGLMATLIVIELFTLQFAIKTMSAVRSYVGSEGLWSKAQKDAAYTLQKYGHSHDEKDYQTYLNYLKVPLGYRKARLELSKKNYDYQVAASGMLEGRVHPDDVKGAINLFRRFSNVEYIHRAIEIWSKGDTLMAQFMSIGENLHKEINAANPSPERINTILAQIDPVNTSLTKLEDDFSYTLGAGSRWLTGLILSLLLGLVLTVEICSLSITILVSRGISKGLKEIIGSANRIASGDLSSRAVAFSHDEIGVLAESFNEMAAKLEEKTNTQNEIQSQLKESKEVAERSLAIKENFLANMSHEIRTPMNAVLGFTHLLEDTALDERQKEFVKAIKISGQNLMTIINDILDYSRLESGRIVIEQIPFSIREAFNSLSILLQQKAREKNIKLKFDIDRRIPESLLGDPTRLMQMLLNLSDNALKFTERGSVEISATLDKQTEDTARVAFNVADTGKGIPADKLSAIFERFTQASAETTRKHGGTGLGLSIVKSLVELQKGSISVSSTVGGGSVFTFVISYKIDPANVHGRQQQDAEVKRAGKKQLNILIAEDNKMNQILAVTVLSKYGFTADVAENGKVAIEMLEQNKYDLILMDMQMPEMDGYEATRYIRNVLNDNIPIIAFTAHAMSGEKDKCLALGMNDYISKPFDAKDLHDKIVGLFK